jgi:5-methylcytosine-specific restriction endonuclease McrA
LEAGQEARHLKRHLHFRARARLVAVPIRPENIARYPKDWKTRSRFVRFYRAKNRCEWCGCENYQPHPATGSKVVLTVAHVHDDRPEASGLLNLAALCQRCHNRHDAKDRLRRRREREETKSPTRSGSPSVEAWNRRQPIETSTPE